jgi:hypothetical protein
MIELFFLFEIIVYYYVLEIGPKFFFFEVPAIDFINKERLQIHASIPAPV